ncbi:MAG: hypothetical protein DWQ05_18520 [Calditrichaeota bacterium]|nr:MAG: hypothetical protein DWQ05_18520 [Calditrichota bacterium]
MKPDKNIYRFVISTPSRFVGEYSKKIFIGHFWDFENTTQYSVTENPYSKNYYVISINRPVGRNPRITTNLPNMYNVDGNEIMLIMAVLYGKTFFFNGEIQAGEFLTKPFIDINRPLNSYKWHFNSHKKRIDTNFNLNFAELTNVEHIINKVGKSRPKYHTTFFNASNLYSRALQNFEHHPDLAFIDLVSAGEILTANFKINEKTIQDIELENLFKRIRNNCKSASEILELLKLKAYNIRNKFSNGLFNFLDDNFFKYTYSGNKDWAINKENILICLKATYDLRSQIVHSGMALGKIINVNNLDSEIFSVFPAEASKEKFKLLSKSLNFLGLERVIRYSLLKLIKVI